MYGAGDQQMPEKEFCPLPPSFPLLPNLFPEQECGFMGPEIGKCAPGEKHPGLWEVPLYQLQKGEELFGVACE